MLAAPACWRRSQLTLPQPQAACLRVRAVQELDLQRFQQDEARKKAEKAGQMEVLKVQSPACTSRGPAQLSCFAAPSSPSAAGAQVVKGLAG